MKYSIIIPVYNRPGEVAELLETLTLQTMKDFEVVIVEDGSHDTCQEVVASFAETALSLNYLVKPNSGPADSRNYGAKHAKGSYYIFLDSDCLLPNTYMEMVDRALSRSHADAFGGPDSAHPDFSVTQKAINYAMTSFFTTGGIRGGKKKLDRFYPRSFNMGIAATLYEALHGFSSDMRFGEDVDFSMRIFESGHRAVLIPEAWVWHKRRTDLKKFFKQVHNSGIARINLTLRHPGSLKLVHLLPTLFTVGTFLLILLAATGLAYMTIDTAIGETVALLGLLPLALYALLVAIDSGMKNKSVAVALKSVAASFVQLTGYGSGFLRACWETLIMKRGEIQAFRHTFYQ